MIYSKPFDVTLELNDELYNATGTITIHRKVRGDVDGHFGEVILEIQDIEFDQVCILDERDVEPTDALKESIVEYIKGNENLDYEEV